MHSRIGFVKNRWEARFHPHWKHSRSAIDPPHATEKFMRRCTAESIVAVLAGLSLAACKRESAAPVEAEPSSAAAPTSSDAGAATVAAKEVTPAAASASPAPSGSVKTGEKKCAPGACAPGKCG
jgi:hypothetical protein